MKGFLLDTNVLSEFSRSGFPPDANVERWMESMHPEMLFTSVLSIGELRKGIERLTPSRKRIELEHWLEADLTDGLETISFLSPRPFRTAGACFTRLALTH